MTVKLENIRIGTRGSPLALAQAHMVRDGVMKNNPAVQTEIVTIKTSGDWIPSEGEGPLKASAGGKAQFAKEIEEALLEERVDIAVHSMKDMDSTLPDGLMIDHMLPREDARDCFLVKGLANFDQKIEAWPDGFVVGSVSARRTAFLLAKNPALRIAPLRGNVGTRIEKLRSGQVNGTILAVAGLKRLGMAGEISFILEPEDMLPAAGQGAVGIEMRTEDRRGALGDLLDTIGCRETLIRVKAERAAVKALGGGCHTPVGAYAVRQGDELFLRVAVVAPDGSDQRFRAGRTIFSGVEDAEYLGQEIGNRLKAEVPSSWLERHG